MSLQDLQEVLRSQVHEHGAIAVSAQTLAQANLAASAGFDETIRSYLKLSDPLSVAAASAPAPSGNQLTVAGTTSFLGVNDVSGKIIFTLEADNLVDVLVIATLPADWTFSTSFPRLVGYPFAELSISQATFLLTTAAQTNYAWNNHQPPLALKRGLNFASLLGMERQYGLLQHLIESLSSTDTAVFTGTIDPSGFTDLSVGTPVLSLCGAVGGQITAKTAFNLSLPQICLTSSPDENKDLVYWLVFSSTLSVKQKPFCTFQAGIFDDSSSLSFCMLPTETAITPEEIIELIGGVDFAQDIPAPLKEVLSAVGLKGLGAMINLEPLEVVMLNVVIGKAATESWTIGEFSLKNLDLNCVVFSPFANPRGGVSVNVTATATIFQEVFKGDFDFEITADDDGDLSIAANYVDSVSLNDLVAKLSANKVTIPESVAEIEFTDFGLVITKNGANYDWQLHGSADGIFSLALATGPIDVTFQALVQSTSGQRTYQLAGGVHIGDEVFEAELDLSATQKQLTATWTSVGHALGFGDIARAFGWDSMPAIPEGLDLALTDAGFTYEFTGNTVAMSATSANYGQILFASLVAPADSPNAGQRVYLFAVDIPLHVQLSDLPVVGDKLPADIQLGVQDLQVIVTSAKLESSDVTALNGLIADRLGDTPLIPASLGKGLTFAAKLQMGTASKPVVIPLTGGGTTLRAPADATALGAGVADPRAGAPAAAYQAAAKWFDIEKSFGPVQFKRIGVQYEDSKLFFLLDASLTLATLSLGLEGLGIGSPLSDFKPAPHIDGISVSFSSGPITISGGLLRVPVAQLPPNVEYEYLGQVTIAIKPWMIMGAASFARISGSPSFFIFAQVNGTFGGPPAFFVTGFMGGFGYNSQLTLPAPEEVYKFPFVAGFSDPAIFGQSPTPASVLEVLLGGNGSPAWVTPTVGETWIAAGVLFRSFELVIGKALVAVTFGKDLEIALLGLASASLPQGATTDAYAYIELQLEAIFKPEDGYFGLVASLTPNSFVLAKDCHLTGGFAFCLWFGSNTHAGDFVVTVGGYHPAFTPPAWYPAVTVVGFNWKVDTEVTIKGGAYFALTPSAVMAGGSLEVLFQTNSVKAWFTACANFLIAWKPFHFVGNIGISIGASVRVDLAFTTVTLSFELGASLAIWGPPTGGIVTVHLSIISFNIPFGIGKDGATPKALEWSGFEALLPQGKTMPALASRATLLSAAPSAPTPPQVLGVEINRGLSRQDATGVWYVRADELIFTSVTAVPATSFGFGVGAVPALAAGAASVIPPPTINIRPMAATGVTSAHTVKLISITEDKEIGFSNWTQIPQARSLPEAMWGKPIPQDETPAPTSATIPGLPVGVQFLAPPAIAGPTPGAINIASLIDPLGGGYLPLTPASQADPLPAPVPDPNVIASIMKTLAAPGAQTAQKNLVAALTGLLAAPPTSEPLKVLMEQAGQTFSQPPLRAA